MKRMRWQQERNLPQGSLSRCRKRFRAARGGLRSTRWAWGGDGVVLVSVAQGPSCWRGEGLIFPGSHVGVAGAGHTPEEWPWAQRLAFPPWPAPGVAHPERRTFFLFKGTGSGRSVLSVRG